MISLFRFEVQSSSSLSWVVRRPTFERPNLGMTTTELRESDPQLRIRQPTLKIHQWYHNIWSSGIFQRSVFQSWGWRRLNFEKVMTPQLRIRPPTSKIQQWYHKIWSRGIFGVQSFGVQIRCSILFDVQYLSALGHLVFGHSMLGPYSALGPIRCSVIRCSVIRCSVFRRSVIRRSVIRRPIFRRSVGESRSNTARTDPARDRCIPCSNAKSSLEDLIGIT